MYIFSSYGLLGLINFFVASCISIFCCVIYMFGVKYDNYNYLSYISSYIRNRFTFSAPVFDFIEGYYMKIRDMFKEKVDLLSKFHTMSKLFDIGFNKIYTLLSSLNSVLREIPVLHYFYSKYDDLAKYIQSYNSDDIITKMIMSNMSADIMGDTNKMSNMSSMSSMNSMSNMPGKRIGSVSSFDSSSIFMKNNKIDTSVDDLDDDLDSVVGNIDLKPYDMSKEKTKGENFLNGFNINNISNMNIGDLNIGDMNIGDMNIGDIDKIMTPEQQREAAKEFQKIFSQFMK